MSDIVIYFAVAIIASFLALYVKQIRADMALCITLAGVIFLLWGIFPKVNLLVSDIRSFTQIKGINQDYITAVLKIIGITYLCEFATDICTDSGAVSIARHVETIGKITVAFIALPIVEDVFSLILDLLR